MTVSWRLFSERGLVVRRARRSRPWRVALLRQDRAVSSMKVAHIVVTVCVVVVGFRFSFSVLKGSYSGSRSRFGGVPGLPERSTGSLKPLFAHSSQIVGGSFAVLFASRSRRRTIFGRHKARVSL